MRSIASLGISPAELNEQVAGRVWARWVEAEPALLGIAGLDALHGLRGRAADDPLGALVRLAAKDGRDEQLTAVAVVHQMEGGVRRLVNNLRDLSDDIEAVVVGALWAEVRSFPWRRRTRAFAASLLFDTRAAVIEVLLPGRTRGGPEPVVFLDPQLLLAGSLHPVSCTWDTSAPCEQSAEELLELIDWALAGHVIDREDSVLLLDLVAAGEEVADGDTPRTLRGTTSQAAVLRVAERRGVSGKTVMRHRDRVVASLRQATSQYLADVA